MNATASALAAIATFALAGPAAAGEPIVATLQVLFGGDGGASRGAWEAGWGGATAARADGGLRFAITRPGQAGLVNFNGHQALPLDPVHGDPAPVVSFELRLRADASRRFRFGWRDGGDPVWATRAEPIAPGGEWRRMVLPLAERPAGFTARGWAVGLDGPGEVDLRNVVLGSLRAVSIEAVARDALYANDMLALAGRTSAGQVAVEVRVDGAVALSRPASVADGAWTCRIRRADIPPFAVCSLVARVPGDAGPAAAAPPAEVYAYPERTASRLPAVERQANLLLAGGRPFAFVGINHTDLMMPHVREFHPEELAREVGRMAGWGMRAMRVGLSWGMIQPAEGVFPGDPRYSAELRSRGLNERWIEELDYLVALAGQHGIYAVIDLHEPPCDPYRYFLGGDPNKRDQPGTAISWLSGDRTKAAHFDLSLPRHRAALLSTWRWLAQHFKGDGNILGFEPPFNEPHDAYLSSQANWAALTSECALAVKAIDPQRLQFAMVAGWGHDNVGWSHTWLQPTGVDGISPHHYLANGPVPLRADATTFNEPWNAREQAPTFAHAMAAVWLASATHQQPVYNGEGGDWLPRVFLPQVDEPLARQMMYEATLAQCYAAGVAGHFNWRVTHDDAGYDLRVFAAARRMAPVLAAGPIDWSKAEVGIIQNSEAVPSTNGHNFACVPFAEMQVALHLGPVHYITDDEIVYRGIVRESKGLEQVSDASASLSGYKAILVDPRNLDARVAAALKSLAIPQLVVPDAGTMDLQAVAAFLAAHGVGVDRETPADIQVAVGPRHLVLFRRAGESGPARLRTPLAIPGSFKLIAEDGTAVFSGTAAELRRDGCEVVIARWRMAILRVER